MRVLLQVLTTRINSVLRAGVFERDLRITIEIYNLQIRRCVYVFTPPPVGGRGIVFGRFLCFFVSNITRSQLDRFA